MILADKIIDLRKKNGMSQEELAGIMNVSRQSVSKWESAQAVPDLNKIILLSQVFGVSTDYLLKDEVEEVEYSQVDTTPQEDAVQQVSLEMANEYLHINETWAGKTALGVALCILSPIAVIILAALSEDGGYDISENAAAGMGMSVLFFMIASAVAIFVMGGMKLNKYEFLEKVSIETAYGVAGMVKERKERYANSHMRAMVIGITLCVLAVIPIFGVLVISNKDIVAVLGVALLLILIASGVFLIIKTSTIWNGYLKLLEEGDYTREKKADARKLGSVMGIYWMLILAAYLAYSFITNEWHRSWIIWPVAGVLCAPVKEIARILRK